MASISYQLPILPPELLGVQLNNELFVGGQRNVGAFWNFQQLSFERSFVESQPGQFLAASDFPQTDVNLVEVLGLLFDLDKLVRTDLIRWDIDHTSVDQDMTMPDQLSSGFP